MIIRVLTKFSCGYFADFQHFILVFNEVLITIVEEKIAYNFLINLGYKSIDFEPNGKSTAPDFVINNSIAIEVRRMNKHIDINNCRIPIEKTKYELIPRFKNLLNEINNPKLDFSIAITLIYKRPVNISKELLGLLKESISNSTNNGIFEKEVFVNPHISYLLYKGNGRAEKTYYLTYIKDMDKGGNIQDVRFNAFKICLKDKTNKMKHLQNKYKEIWLILIDDIFSRVDYTTKQDFERYPYEKSFFNKIILVSKRDASNWIEL